MVNAVSARMGALEQKLKDLEDQGSPYTDNDTRNKLALKFVNGYLRLLAGTILLVCIYNIVIRIIFADGCDQLNLQDTIVTISSIVGTPLGFVVGYYFKSNSI